MVAQKVGDFCFLFLLCLSFCVPPLLLTMFFLQIVVQKGSPRGVHFRRAGPREKVFVLSNHALRMLLESWKYKYAVFPISGLFQVRGSTCLYSDMWRIVPRNQHSDSGDSMWLELYVWCSWYTWDWGWLIVNSISFLKYYFFKWYYSH